MDQEFLWSIFENAAKSGHADKLIRPFPKNYLRSDGIRDFESLSKDIKGRPSYLKQFLSKNLPKINICTKNDFLQKYFSNRKFHRPDLVLSVNDAGGQEDRFFSLGSSSSIYAFHGTKSENMYSILQHGLINNLNERAAFGEGTYLSTEIDVALGFAPSQRVRIPLGGKIVTSIRTIALCEVAENVKGVKFQKESNSSSATPQTYVIVQNDDAVILRHVLVYYDSIRTSSYSVFTSLFWASAFLFIAILSVKWLREAAILKTFFS